MAFIIIMILAMSSGNKTTDVYMHVEGTVRHILLSNGLLSPLIIVVCIPFYLCLIRPRIRYCIPGILKRMGLGIVLMLLSLLCTLAMDVVVHEHSDHLSCMFSGYQNIEGKFFPVTANTTLAIPPLLHNTLFLLQPQCC